VTQPFLPQHPEKPVTAHGDAFQSQFRPRQVEQLPAPKPRLQHPLSAHKLFDQPLVRFLPLFVIILRTGAAQFHR
jgi:hypothetical protein